MTLFIIIPIICLLLTFTGELIRLLRINTIFGGPQPSVLALLAQLNEARDELERVKQSPTAGEYTRVVKTMRAERKVKDILEKLETEKRLTFVDYNRRAEYLLRTVLSLLLVVISLTNRSTPVIVLNERLNLQPFGGLLSFPTGVHNAISVPLWVLSSNSVSSLIAQLVKRIKS